MPQLTKQVTVIAGHYGSGKTEFAVNLALSAAAGGQKITLADLDIVNPYFCSREQENTLKAAGIEMIAPSPLCRTADVPALPAEVAKVFADSSRRAILDVGGDSVGAKVLSRYLPQFKSCEYDMWIILNANRPQTADANNALHYICGIEEASRLKVTGIINNTHLCRQTTPDDALRGYKVADSLCKMTGLPLICSVVPKKDSESYRNAGIEGELFPIDIMMKKPWEL